MGVSFLGLNIPTSAGEVGDNLHNNAIAAAQSLAMRGREAAAIPAQIGGGMQDFFHGLATGHALGQQAALPAKVAKAQVKDVPIGGKFVDLPGVGRVQMPSDAWLRSHPAQTPDMSTAAPAKAASSSKSAKSTNPFDEAVARFATADGGISLNELAALSHSGAETSMLRTQPKDPSQKDQVAGKLNAVADQIYTAKMAQAQALKAKDPAGAAKLQDDAVSGYQDALQKILGSNPVDLQTAAAMGETGKE